MAVRKKSAPKKTSTGKKSTVKKPTLKSKTSSTPPKQTRSAPKKPMGRPVGYIQRVFNSDDEKRIYELACVGATLDQIAHVMRVSERTLMYRMKDNDNLSAAYKNGRNDAIAFASNKLFTHIRRGNLAAIIFYLKTQARWKEVQGVELTADKMIESFVGKQSGVGSSDDLLTHLNDNELKQLHTVLKAARDRSTSKLN